MTVPVPAKDVLQNPSIEVRKFISDGDGGWELAPDDTWQFCGSNASLLGGVACKNNGSAVWNDVIATQAGSQFTFTESQLNGSDYEFDHVDGTNCVQSGTSAVATVAADFDTPQSAVCNFYNREKQGSLTLVKHVVNDNGGTADASAWTLAAAGGGSTPINGTGSPATGTSASISADVTAGVEYTLSESGGPSGYSSDGVWVCTGDTSGFVSPNKITLSGGQSASCTITNDDDAPSLTLIKHVVNDNGGTAVAGAWTLSAGDNDVTGSETGALATDQAGTYALSESTVAGYTNTSITCDDDPAVEVTSVTLGLGEDVTCTFVNDDNAPALYLAKHVVNDNGGTELASAWDLSAGANTVTGAEGGAFATAVAGTYALSESAGPDGYTNTSITCDDDPGVEVTAVTLGLGETITCTFVNDDDAPSLTLIKHVVNDNGGTELASAWTLSAGDNDVTGSETGALATDQAGTYALSESTVAGYTNTSITCDDDPAVEVTSVTLGLGEDVTCTFVNDDNAPALYLAKHVVNDNGGTELASAWDLSAGANTVTGAEGGAFATAVAGTYALSESAGPDGYTNTSITCDDDPGVEVTAVTLGLGETITCTFVNDDDAPSPHAHQARGQRQRRDRAGLRLDPLRRAPTTVTGCRERRPRHRPGRHLRACPRSTGPDRLHQHEHHL